VGQNFDIGLFCAILTTVIEGMTGFDGEGNPEVARGDACHSYKMGTLNINGKPQLALAA
jgi:hypothetical protein